MTTFDFFHPYFGRTFAHPNLPTVVMYAQVLVSACLMTSSCKSMTPGNSPATTKQCKYRFCGACTISVIQTPCTFQKIWYFPSIKPCRISSHVCVLLPWASAFSTRRMISSGGRPLDISCFTTIQRRCNYPYVRYGNFVYRTIWGG